MLPLVLPLLSFAFKNWRLVFIGGAIGAGLGYFAYAKHEAYVQGQQAEIQAMEKANAAAKSAADKAQAEVDACYARGAGFTWDRAAGVCHGPAAGEPAVRRHRR